MRKAHLGLNLILLLATTHLGVSEEQKKEYVPYNPVGEYTHNDQIYYGPQYGLGQQYSSNPFIHNRVETLISALRYDDGNKRVEMDSSANNALWAYYNAESSLDFPKEQLQKHAELFKTEDGKTNIALRLAEINTEIKKITEAKEDTSVVEKHNSLINEGKSLYKQLAEKLKKEDNQKLALALSKDVTALPEVQVQMYAGGGMGGMYYGGGHPYYGNGINTNNHMMGLGLNPSAFDVTSSKDQLRAYYEYSEQVRVLYKQQIEEALSKQRTED